MHIEALIHSTWYIVLGSLLHLRELVSPFRVDFIIMAN